MLSFNEFLLIFFIKYDPSFSEKPKNWTTILQRLFLPANLDLYQFCYHPLISERVKEIISTSWQATIAQTQAEVNELMTSAQKSKKGKFKLISRKGNEIVFRIYLQIR